MFVFSIGKIITHVDKIVMIHYNLARDIEMSHMPGGLSMISDLMPVTSCECVATQTLDLLVGVKTDCLNFWARFVTLEEYSVNKMADTLYIVYTLLL